MIRSKTLTLAVILAAMLNAGPADCASPQAPAVKKLVASWKATNSISTVNQWLKHIRIPAKLLHLGSKGQITLLFLPPSGSDSSDVQLQFCRVDALLRLNEVGVRKLSDPTVRKHVEFSLIYVRDADRKRFDACVNRLSFWSRDSRYGTAVQTVLDHVVLRATAGTPSKPTRYHMRGRRGFAQKLPKKQSREGE